MKWQAESLYFNPYTLVSDLTKIVYDFKKLKICLALVGFIHAFASIFLMEKSCFKIDGIYFMIGVEIIFFRFYAYLSCFVLSLSFLIYNNCILIIMYTQMAFSLCLWSVWYCQWLRLRSDVRRVSLQAIRCRPSMQRMFGKGNFRFLQFCWGFWCLFEWNLFSPKECYVSTMDWRCPLICWNGLSRYNRYLPIAMCRNIIINGTEPSQPTDNICFLYYI